MLREKAQPKFHPKFMEATVTVRRKKTFTVELNSHGKCAEKSCELSEHANYPSLFLCEVALHYRELCRRQSCKLSERCELASVKLSGLYCMCHQEMFMTRGVG